MYVLHTSSVLCCGYGASQREELRSALEDEHAATDMDKRGIGETTKGQSGSDEARRVLSFVFPEKICFDAAICGE